MAYREEDRVLKLEREVAEANARIAELNIERAIWKHGASKRWRLRVEPTFVAAAIGTWVGLGLATAAYCVFHEDGFVLFGTMIGLLGGSIYGLVGAITPGARRP